MYCSHQHCNRATKTGAKCFSLPGFAYTTSEAAHAAHHERQLLATTKGGTVRLVCGVDRNITVLCRVSIPQKRRSKPNNVASVFHKSKRRLCRRCTHRILVELELEQSAFELFVACRAITADSATQIHLGFKLFWDLVNGGFNMRLRKSSGKINRKYITKKLEFGNQN